MAKRWMINRQQRDSESRQRQLLGRTVERIEGGENRKTDEPDNKAIGREEVGDGIWNKTH